VSPSKNRGVRPPEGRECDGGVCLVKQKAPAATCPLSGKGGKPPPRPLRREEKEAHRKVNEVARDHAKPRGKEPPPRKQYRGKKKKKTQTKEPPKKVRGGEKGEGFHGGSLRREMDFFRGGFQKDISKGGVKKEKWNISNK